MNPELAQKIKALTKLAVSQVEELEAKIAEYEDREAKTARTKTAYEKALQKAAKALYESDFITDDDGSLFVKKAQENPAHLARIIEKLCEASDVMTMGRPASVSSLSAKSANFDPVKARAFGMNKSESYSILDDE